MEFNLQHFAKTAEFEGEVYELDTEESEETEVEDDVQEGIEIEVDDETESSESNESDSEENDDEEVEEEVTDKEPESEPEKTVPLKALQAEREKFKKRLEEAERLASATKKLMQQSGVDNIDDFNRQLDALEAKKLEQQGIDPQQAQYFVQQQREMNEMKRQLQKQKLDIEAGSMKQNDFYADIDDYRDELEEYAVRNNMSLEQSYMALRGAQRMKEFQAQLEQKMLNDQAKKQKKRVDTSPSGKQKQKTKLNLTPDELAIAKMAKMTPEEYYKYKKK